MTVGVPQNSHREALICKCGSDNFSASVFWQFRSYQIGSGRDFAGPVVADLLGFWETVGRTLLWGSAYLSPTSLSSAPCSFGTKRLAHRMKPQLNPRGTQRQQKSLSDPLFLSIPSTFAALQRVCMQQNHSKWVEHLHPGPQFRGWLAGSSLPHEVCCLWPC